MSNKKRTVASIAELPLTGVESHAHLDSKQFRGELEDILDRAKKAGIAQIGQVFLSPEAWEKHHALFSQYQELFFLLGIHPSEAHLFDNDVIEKIRTIALSDSRIKAIGEIGLDYHWKDCPPKRQKELFRLQLSLTKDLHLPVIIHCREAEDDTFALLDEEGMPGQPLLWHCFGGNWQMAQKILDRGWHISIPGPVTFPANTALREAVSLIPADRIMVETDCPYLAPVPMRGKRNEPSLLVYTIQKMAEVRNEPVEQLWTQCGNNARAFFGLN